MKAFAKKFYASKEWKSCRDVYIHERLLIDGGLCERCHEHPGIELHHVEHLSIFNINNPDITVNPANLMWLCKDCHFAMHKESIMQGFKYKKKQKILSENGTWFDESGRIHKQEIIIVYGAPASGKTTYVKQHKYDTDMVIDLDAIMNALCLCNKSQIAGNLLGTALDVRDFLYSLIEQSKVDCKRIWIIATLPKRTQREELTERFKAEKVFIDKSFEECIENAKRDPERSDKLLQEFIIKKWFEDYEV